jgi:hypothetical protein
MGPDCIDPEAGGLLREIMKKSVPENVADYGCEYDFVALWEARLHWSGCPACRPEFTGVPAFFAQIGAGLENRFRENLSYVKDDFLSQKNKLLAVADDLPSAYPEIIVRLAVEEDDVLGNLLHGQEVLCLRVSTDSPEEPGPSLRGGELPDLWSCREFICSLELNLQRFVYAVSIAHDLLQPVRERVDSEYAETGRPRVTVEASEDLQQRMQTAIANSQLDPAILFQTIDLSSIACIIPVEDWLKRLTTAAQTDLPQKTLTTHETKTIQGALQEWKRDFDNFEDSVKAGQMELVRLIERNSRSAAANEPYIVAQLGEPLYSRLHEKTRRAIQLAEYLYNINQEPDGFSLTAITMAQGYENELIVRIIGPFSNQQLTTAVAEAGIRLCRKEYLTVRAARTSLNRSRRTL